MEIDVMIKLNNDNINMRKNREIQIRFRKEISFNLIMKAL